MKRTKVRKGLAVVLALFVALAVALPFTQQVQAAGTKTIYVVVEQKSVTTNPAGEESTSVDKFTYDKKGRTKSIVTKNESYTEKTVYSYNKKSNISSIKRYSNGKLQFLTSFKYNKKGLETGTKEYSVTDGKKTLDGTSTNTYWKNGNIKKSVFKAADGSYTSTATYSKKGVPKKTVMKDEYGTDTTTYDSKGNLKKSVYESTDGINSNVSTSTYKYDKKGFPVKHTYKVVYKTEGKTTATSTNTVTYKNTVKKGRLVKQERTTSNVYKTTDGQYTDTYKTKTVTTYKYKKIKVK